MSGPRRALWAAALAAALVASAATYVVTRIAFDPGWPVYREYVPPDLE